MAAQLNRKRPRFDPERCLSNVRAHLDLQKRLEDAYRNLLSLSNQVVRSPVAAKVLGAVDIEVKELTLGAYLGMEGLDCLRTAVQMVPETFPRQLKTCYVSEILKSVCVPSDVEPRVERHISPAVVDKLLPSCAKGYFQRAASPRSYMEELRKVSENTGKAHTSFIAPPVTSCINSSCPRKGDPFSLTIHHDEVDAVIFDLHGATPATKISLKCTSCATIYNYSKFGKSLPKESNFMLTQESWSK